MRLGTRPSRLWPALLAVLLVCLAVPAGASAVNVRTVYVSHGLGAPAQVVTAHRINANGTLSAIAGSPFATNGALVEGMAIRRDAKRIYVTSFGNTSVVGYNVNAASGALSFVPGSPFITGAADRTPLSVSPNPNALRPFVYVGNHGSNVGSWRVNANGSLSQVAGSPFAVTAGHTNPFSPSVSPNGRRVYVPLENTSPGGGSPDRLTVYRANISGSLTLIQSVATGNNPFGSAITPNGKFLYVSNPEADPGFANGSISAYAVNAGTGLLTELPGSKFSVGAGNHPLAMAISPDSQFLYVATRASNTVNGYRINANGSLSALAGSPYAVAGGTNGKALALTPDGKRLYVSNQVSNNIGGFNVAANGTLTPIPGLPTLTGGTSPDLESIVITPNQTPKATFTAQVKEAKQATSFNGGPSVDTDGGTIASYEWDFGDGITQTTTTPTTTHTYQAAGTYAVTLRVTDNEGCSITLIFTGKATLCNGTLLAKAAGTAVVPAPKPGPGQNTGVFRGGGPIGGEGVLPGTPRCRGRLATVVGTRSRRRITRIRGTRKADVIFGTRGRDSINGRGGNDLICAGAGRDRVSAGRGADRVFGGSGGDRISGGSGGDRLFGQAGRDRIRGGRGRDRISGGSGRDDVKQ
jgi:6-phosphogluconolactonase (cycloisomerase 2 family)